MNLANRIVEIRLSLGLSQKKVAEITGLRQSSISSWELGRRTPLPDGLIKLADAFGCSVDYILGRESEDGIINIQNYNIEKSEIQTLFDKLDRFEKERVLGYVRALVAMKDTGAGNQAN